MELNFVRTNCISGQRSEIMSQILSQTNILKAEAFCNLNKMQTTKSFCVTIAVLLFII